MGFDLDSYFGFTYLCIWTCMLKLNFAVAYGHGYARMQYNTDSQI